MYGDLEYRHQLMSKSVSPVSPPILPRSTPFEFEMVERSLRWPFVASLSVSDGRLTLGAIKAADDMASLRPYTSLTHLYTSPSALCSYA